MNEHIYFKKNRASEYSSFCKSTLARILDDILDRNNLSKTDSPETIAAQTTEIKKVMQGKDKTGKEQYQWEFAKFFLDDLMAKKRRGIFKGAENDNLSPIYTIPAEQGSFKGAGGVHEQVSRVGDSQFKDEVIQVLRDQIQRKDNTIDFLEGQVKSYHEKYFLLAEGKVKTEPVEKPIKKNVVE